MYFKPKSFGHQRSRRAFAKESIAYTRGVEHGEEYADCAEMVFINCDDYVERKLRMLRKDMYIEPTWEETEHLRTLTNRWDIDRSVKSIIDRAWS